MQVQAPSKLTGNYAAISQHALSLIHILLGSLYIALLAQIEIPLQPVPVTLHTFAVLSLALALGSKKACLATLLYLLEATVGLPVFPNAYSEPAWILMPSAGYCLSFPFAAYLVGKVADNKSSETSIFLSLCLSQLIIYGLGVSWLSRHVGWELALQYGLYPFVFTDFLKLLAAAFSYMAFKKIGISLRGQE